MMHSEQDKWQCWSRTRLFALEASLASSLSRRMRFASGDNTLCLVLLLLERHPEGKSTFFLFLFISKTDSLQTSD